MATIVIPDQSPEEAEGPSSPAVVAAKAAEILNEYLERSSGTTLPIVTASHPPKSGNLILLGKSELSEKYQLQTPEKSESVRIVTFPRGLAILGEIAPAGTNNKPYSQDRGTIHGVYLFLEKYLGFRFFFEEGPYADLGTVVPKHHSVKIPEVDEIFAPVFPYRLTHDRASGILLEGSATDFRCNHTHEGWAKVYKDSHPEYFSLQADGTRDFSSLCYSNPDVLKREIEHIEAYYKTGKWVGVRPPTEKYIQVEPVDNWNECQCDGCQALIDPQKGRFGRHSRLWWDHYIRNLADEVSKRWPDKRISALAYQGRLMPGEKPLPENVDVMVCIHNSGINFLKQPDARVAIDNLLTEWSEKVGNKPERLFVWVYYCYPTFWTTAPLMYPNLVQQFLQEYRGKIGGVFVNRSNKDPNHQYTHFMEALTMRLLWEPDLDLEAYLSDYCKQYFGPAAEEMEKMYRTMIEAYEKTVWNDYRQEEHTAWASPTMFYGQTYNSSVVEKIEQFLYEAQEAVGLTKRGRESIFRHGEGWFIRRNGSSELQSYGVILEAEGGPVVSPTLKWEDSFLRYDGVLNPGQKLVVGRDAKAMLLPVDSERSKEIIPEWKRLLKGKKLTSESYEIEHLDIPVVEGDKFQIKVSGFANAGGKALLQVDWYGVPSTTVMEDFFNEDNQTISATISVPKGAQLLRNIRFKNAATNGEIYLSDVSLCRMEQSRDGEQISKGLDVSSRIRGTIPEIQGNQTQLFHIFSDNSFLSTSGDKIDIHLGQANDRNRGPRQNVQRIAGSGGIKVRLFPLGNEEMEKENLDIYQQRVAWMADALEDFHPEFTMYAVHDGFLPAAHTVHKWLQLGAPSYEVTSATRTPSKILDSTWRGVPAIKLVRGRERARIPLDNLGFDPGNAETEVRFLQDEKRIYVLIQCQQPESVNEADSISLVFHLNGQKQRIYFSPPTDLQTEIQSVNHYYFHTKKGWSLYLAIPKSALEEIGDNSIALDIERTRMGGIAYLWSPPMDAPWHDISMARRGRISLVEKKSVERENGGM